MLSDKYVLTANFLGDILIRIFLVCIYAIFEVIPPFKRVVHPEEIWLYKNPRKESYLPLTVLWEIVVLLPLITVFVNYLKQKEKADVIEAFLAFTLTVTLNGAITNILKVAVGRPRPDFYYRCFPNGEGNLELKDCTGARAVINDGLKSFPSGHSSIAFASLGFLSLYMAGKMQLFVTSGRGTTWKLLLFIFPLLLASLIAISRTCDYHHHWQDVLCGSILGFAICWLCYHNYYPPLNSEKCHLPWLLMNKKQSLHDAKQSDSVKEV